MSNLDKRIVKRNPDYGNGIYRRRIRLENLPQHVIAELEDATHGFRLKLSYADEQVSDISAQPIRYPFNTCPGAVDALKPLIGCALTTDSSSLRRVLDPGQNCTHLYDLAVLALAHSTRSTQHKVYDIIVPDERESGSSISVLCDGEPVHQWQVKSHCLTEPQFLQGKPLMHGFYSWAIKAFSKDELEAAIILQRGYFVAQTRRYDYINSAGRSALGDKMPEGACYTYNAGVVEQAFQTEGMVRDFTDTQEQLLKFV